MNELYELYAGLRDSVADELSTSPGTLSAMRQVAADRNFGFEFDHGVTELLHDYLNRPHTESGVVATESQAAANQ
ncbi:MAG: hypothetical protein WC498_01900 [Candidatus Saccharimonadales bacterium]